MAGADFVVVANRLPVDREVLADGKVRWHESPGGLVTALAPVMAERRGTWIGWAGSTGPADAPFTQRGTRLVPVPLDDHEFQTYYEGFSNSTLWPLYHDAIQPPTIRRSWWAAYREVNERFAEHAARAAAPGATVWVHDYQLQLVPTLLRERRPDLRIGFFLHIPFPPEELFMRLPWRAEIVRSLLDADLVGFQRPVAAQNFMRVARRLLGFHASRSTVHVDGRQVRVDAFPISIDFAAIDATAATPAVVRHAARFRKELGAPEVVLLGVDRLDYTKGIDLRLAAYEEVLESGAVDPGRIVLVQVATPSRERVASYQQVRGRVEQTVGRINGRFGSVGRPAVHYLHQNLKRDTLVALYAAADVLLVTPLRDGMNLVAKEYVAARHEGGGVLVLSEFAGAAGELQRALLVNPYDVTGLGHTIVRAIELDPRDARRRMRDLRRQVADHDVHAWARAYIAALEGSEDR